MKNNVFFLFFLLAGQFTRAQINYANIYDTHTNTQAARYFPSMLGSSFGQGEVTLFNAYAWAGNNALPYGQLNNLLFAQQLSNTQMQDIVNHLAKSNTFFLGADIQLIDAAFKIKNKDGGEILTMEVGERERAMADMQLSKNLLSTALLGNDQFAGENVSLGPTRVNAIYMHDFYLGLSAPFYLETAKHSLEFRPGLRGSFLMGVANVYTQTGNASMFTEPNGKYINFDYNYLANTSYPGSLPSGASGAMSTLFGGQGKGWGLDGGIGIKLDDFLSFDLDVVDGGQMTFKENLNNYQRQGNYQFTGAQADLFNTGNQPITFNLNENVLNPVQTENKYTTPFAPIITFRTEYRLIESNTHRYDTTEKYFQHHVFLTYVQGTQTLYDATTMPNFSVGYMYSYKNVLNLGLSLSFLGYTKFSTGPFISVKGGPFVISFGSNNLMALIAPKFGTGIDGYINIGFNFGAQHKHTRTYTGKAHDIVGPFMLDTDGDGIPDVQDSCPLEKGLAINHGCPDRDSDGVIDKYDDCPDQPGLAKFNGCPDRDSDGVPDKVDRCPDLPGPKEHHGCPDTDKDGVFDDVDQCVLTPGPVENHGCPWPDRDGDGIPDKDDACPDVFGVPENSGCPKLTQRDLQTVSTANHTLAFETGTITIKDESVAALNALADLLKKKTAYGLRIEAYTDNLGSDESNLVLSQKRASAVKRYLVTQGVDGAKLEAFGYGASKPIADNDTPEGRQKNKRIEMKITFK